MGSPMSPVVANIYMEMFEDLALRPNWHPEFGRDMLMTHSVQMKR